MAQLYAVGTVLAFDMLDEIEIENRTSLITFEQNVNEDEATLFTCDLSKMQITAEAIELLKQVDVKDNLGTAMAHQIATNHCPLVIHMAQVSSDGGDPVLTPVISWQGSVRGVLPLDKVFGLSPEKYDKSVLDTLVPTEISPSADLVAFVAQHYPEEATQLVGDV